MKSVFGVVAHKIDGVVVVVVVVRCMIRCFVGFGLASESRIAHYCFGTFVSKVDGTVVGRIVFGKGVVFE